METPHRKPPSVFLRGDRWTAKLLYPVGHPDKPGGGWANVATGETHQARALMVAEEMRDRIERGLPAKDPEARGPVALMTVGDLAKRFLTEYTRRKIKDLERYRAAVDLDLRLYVLPYLGARPAAMVRRADVLSWLGELRARNLSAHSLNRILARVQALYTFAIDREILTCPHPARGVETAQVRPSQDHLSMLECQALLALGGDLEGAAAVAWHMAATVLYGGERLGEVVALQWPDIDFDRGAILVQHNWTADRTPKSGKARTIPLHPELRPILMRWRERCPASPSGLIFPRPSGKPWHENGEVGVYLADLLKAAKAHAPSKPWHGLRHTFATLLHEATGGNTDAVARILGHSGGGSAVTLGYIHAGLPYLAGELVKLSYGLPREPAEPPKPESAPAAVEAPGEDGAAEVVSLDRARERKRRQSKQAAG